MAPFQSKKLFGFARATKIPISFVIWFTWMEDSELDEIARIIVRSVSKRFCSCVCAVNMQIRCRLIHRLFNKDFGQQIQWIRDILFVFIFKNPRSRFMLELIVIFVSIQNFETRCSNLAASLVQWLVRQYCYSFAAASFEDRVCQNAGPCWIQSYVRSHWFGCSLRPGTPLYWTLDSSALSWSWTLLINLREQQRQLLQDE